MIHLPYSVRRAVEADFDSLTDVHVESIRSVCSAFYSQDIIDEWITPINREKYCRALEQGATIFVAEDKNGQLLGFSEVHRVKDHEYNAAVFVAGRALRKGIGSALYRAAESLAMQDGAESIALNASLAAVAFYEKNGFSRLHRAHSEMSPGKTMEVVRMMKSLSSQWPLVILVPRQITSAARPQPNPAPKTAPSAPSGSLTR